MGCRVAPAGNGNGIRAATNATFSTFAMEEMSLLPKAVKSVDGGSKIN